jgi:hypothetical protein
MSSRTDTRDRPRLATFATSHFCEKARWALEWHGIVFDEVTWPPGLHRILAARAGAKETSLPLLIGCGEIVEGSSAIINWAERNADSVGASNRVRSATKCWASSTVPTRSSASMCAASPMPSSCRVMPMW